MDKDRDFLLRDPPDERLQGPRLPARGAGAGPRCRLWRGEGRPVAEDESSCACAEGGVPGGRHVRLSRDPGRPSPCPRSRSSSTRASAWPTGAQIYEYSKAKNIKKEYRYVRTVTTRKQMTRRNATRSSTLV